MNKNHFPTNPKKKTEIENLIKMIKLKIGDSSSYNFKLY